MEKTEAAAAVTEENEPVYVEGRSTPKHDPWTDMREITLPRAGSNEQQFWFVGVNGRTFQVPRGKRTQVPLPVYECLMEAQAAQQEAFEANRRSEPK